MWRKIENLDTLVKSMINLGKVTHNCQMILDDNLGQEDSLEDSKCDTVND